MSDKYIDFQSTFFFQGIYCAYYSSSVGGVLNIVRRKVELKCPSEKIPGSLTIDLDGVDIGESFKISSIKLDPEVAPTIQGRDFVIATLAAPTVIQFSDL